MKKQAIIASLVIFCLTACDSKPAEKPFVPDPVTPASNPMPAGHPAISNANQPGGQDGTRDVIQSQQGTVVNVINIPQFTYLEIKQSDQSRWIAASTVDAKAGDLVKFDNGSTMTNFTSKTLNRTFPSITFVNRVTVIQTD